MAQPVRAVERVIRILIYLNKHNGSNSNQVALGTKLSRGTAYRMLETLRGAGVVELFEDDGRYWLTKKTKQLSAGFEDEEWISSIARPEMTKLTKAIGWPAMLMTAAGIEMILRATTDPQTSLVFRRHNIGHTLPMLGSAAGRCYLAYCSQARLNEILEVISIMAPEPWASLAANKSAIHDMRAVIRKQGISVAEAPNSPSLTLAVPILVSGEPRAILGMRHFKSAMTESEAISRFSSPLHRTAEQISKQWLAELTK